MCSFTIVLILITTVLIVSVSGLEEKTILDDLFLNKFRIFRAMQFNMKNNQHNQKTSRDQPVISEEVPFPCNTANSRSVERPKSVHALRPGDIDVIGAIGDSLTAGFGLTAKNRLEVSISERGKSFSIGGEGTWREYLTIPNILKVFNPNLIGFSWNTSLATQKAAQFNVAEGGAVSQDLIYMTKVLLKRIKSDPRVNISKDWKMITIFIGANDFCGEICYNDDKESLLKKHDRELVGTLTLLRNNLPRTIVNILPPPSMATLVNLKTTEMCTQNYKFACPCFFGLPLAKHRNELFEFMRRWQNIDLSVGNRSEFSRDDFTVVAQPLFVNYTFPILSNGFADLDYLSQDCFHLSQKGGARVANDLWNNIMEPVGQKRTDGGALFETFKCPTEQQPYIFTNINSD